MLKEAYESVVEIAFENAENKEKVKRKRKYVKNRSVPKMIKKEPLKISIRKSLGNMFRKYVRHLKAVVKNKKKTGV
jgi:hypothetical protein